MAWWVWGLIAVAITVIGYLKLKVWNSMAKKKPTQSEKNED